MNDLSHWNIAATFSASQAAALILGAEPAAAWRDNGALGARLRVVHDRMKHDFARAVDACVSAALSRKGETVEAAAVIPADGLVSAELAAVVGHWLSAPSEASSLALVPAMAMKDGFATQTFTRTGLQAWLAGAKLSSVYDFSGVSVIVEAMDAPADDIDPSDLPEELQAANIAYRAVLKGYGDRNTTFKSRLVAFLKANFNFSDEAVSRIATVANPDKAAGRRKQAA